VEREGAVAAVYVFKYVVGSSHLVGCDAVYCCGKILPPHSITTQKTLSCNFTAVKTQNLAYVVEVHF